MPVTVNKLRRLLKSKHPYIERNLASIVTIIRHSMLNSCAFEEAAQRLKEVRAEAVSFMLVTPCCSLTKVTVTPPKTT